MRQRKWSARRIARELDVEGVQVAVCTVSRDLHLHGVNQMRFLDINGEPLRLSPCKKPGRIVAR